MLADKLRTVSSAAGIQYVGGASATNTAGAAYSVTLSSLTGGSGSSPQSGDLIVVVTGTATTVLARADVGVTTSGYTEVVDVFSDDTYEATMAVAYKVSDGTETTVAVLGSGASSRGAASVVQVWRGVDTVLPLDVLSTSATGQNSVIPNAPSITPITVGAIIVACGLGSSANTNTTVLTTPSGMGNGINVNAAGSATSCKTSIASVAWVSGAYDPAAWTGGGTDAATYAWCSATLALRPNQNQPGPILISSASTINSTTSASLIINKPTGTLEGDLMVGVMSVDGSRTWTGATGWTEVADQGATPSLRVAYKIAGAGEASTYTFTASSAANILSGAIATYRNASYDAIGTITTSASPLVVSEVTASVDYARILAWVARSAGSITITGPANMQTISIDADINSPSNLLEQDSAASYAGGSGTRSFVVGSTSSVAGALISVKPAASYTPYAQYRASTSGNTTTGPDLTVNTPACSPGNVLLFVTSTVGNGATDVSFSTPSGWTLLSGNSNSTTAFQPSMYIFYRIADGSEAASYIATASSTTSSLVGVMLTLVGVDPSTLIAGTTSTGASTTSITATEVSATTNGILLYFGAQGNSSAPVTFTAPSGMTEAIEGSNNAVNADLTIEAAYQEGLSAGLTGSKTATASAAAGTNRYRAILVTVDAL